MATAYDKLIKVTITQPGMQGYNGYLRRHLFKDGKSVEAIPVRMALLLGASCLCEDEKGNQLNPNTYRFDAPEGMGEVSADDFPSVVPIHKTDSDAIAISVMIEEGGPGLSDEPMPVDDVVAFSEPGDVLDDPRVWSLAELEAIADAEGISGLREVGDILSVKGSSIDELVQTNLTKQSSEPSEDSDEGTNEDSGE